MKQEIEKILKIKGDVRGVVFQTDANYVLSKKGEAGLASVEETLKSWGIDLKYKEMGPMGWYPVAWRTASILAIRETFSWSDEEIRKMGENAPRVSVVVKLFFKLFPDIEKFAQQIPKYWSKHYTIGELEVVKLDKENKEIILHLKNFSMHPLQCRYYEGYFGKTVQLTRPKDSAVAAKELKCSFRDGTPYEEYQLKWTK